MRADVIVLATEAYTAPIADRHRDVVPMYSLMVGSEPLTREQWDRDRAGRSADVHTTPATCHLRPAHRRRPHRVRRPRRAVPLRLADRPRLRRRRAASGAMLVETVRELFPVLRDVGVPVPLGRPAGVPRDWHWARPLRPGRRPRRGRRLRRRRRGHDQPRRAHARRPDHSAARPSSCACRGSATARRRGSPSRCAGSASTSARVAGRPRRRGRRRRGSPPRRAPRRRPGTQLLATADPPLERASPVHGCGVSRGTSGGRDVGVRARSAKNVVEVAAGDLARRGR